VHSRPNRNCITAFRTKKWTSVFPHNGSRKRAHRIWRSRTYPVYAGVIVRRHPRKLLVVSNIPACTTVMGMHTRHRKRWSSTESVSSGVAGFNASLVPLARFEPSFLSLESAVHLVHAKSSERKKKNRNFNQSPNTVCSNFRPSAGSAIDPPFRSDTYVHNVRARAAPLRSIDELRISIEVSAIWDFTYFSAFAIRPLLADCRGPRSLPRIPSLDGAIIRRPSRQRLN